MEDLYMKKSMAVRSFVNKSNLLPPLVNFRAIFKISRKYNMATCQIEKVMSTFRAGMFCYLNRRREFEKAGRNISTEHWSNTLCDDEREERKTFDETIKSLSEHPVIFTVIRHPIDRFLSGFVNKCIREKRLPHEKCFGCGGDIECFLRKLYENLSAYHTSGNLTSSETYYVWHFAPTNWYCDLKKSYDKIYLMRYDLSKRKKLAADFVAVLGQAGVPTNQRTYIRGELLNAFFTTVQCSTEAKSIDCRTDRDAFLECRTCYMAEKSKKPKHDVIVLCQPN